MDFFKLMKMLPNVSFISMVIKKVFLSVSIATISVGQIGQCDINMLVIEDLAYFHIFYLYDFGFRKQVFFF